MSISSENRTNQEKENDIISDPPKIEATSMEMENSYGLSYWTKIGPLYYIASTKLVKLISKTVLS